MLQKLLGKAKWAKLERELTKNAKKIWIVAPIPRKYDKKVKVIENGEEIEKIEAVKYNAYRYVYVYDISHTTGKAIPLQSERINCDDKASFYNKLKKFSNVPVIEKELFGGRLGYYSEKENLIAIKNTLSINDKASVLLHEIAHSLYDDFDYSKDRDLSEVFVESVAYIVADYFGLDTSHCSFNYIIKWAKGETKTVLELGGKIQKCANEFIEKLEMLESKKMAYLEVNDKAGARRIARQIEYIELQIDISNYNKIKQELEIYKKVVRNYPGLQLEIKNKLTEQKIV